MNVLLYTGAAHHDRLDLPAAVRQVLAARARSRAALAGAIAHILFLIHDLDDAFAGDWQVDESRRSMRARRASTALRAPS